MAVLTAFASGLGLSSISADNGGEISSVWLIITGLFVVISMVGSYMLGGYITGRMRRPAGQADRNELTVRDGLNGLVVWGLERSSRHSWPWALFQVVQELLEALPRQQLRQPERRLVERRKASDRSPGNRFRSRQCRWRYRARGRAGSSAQHRADASAGPQGQSARLFY